MNGSFKTIKQEGRFYRLQAFMRCRNELLIGMKQRFPPSFNARLCGEEKEKC